MSDDIAYELDRIATALEKAEAHLETVARYSNWIWAALDRIARALEPREQDSPPLQVVTFEDLQKAKPAPQAREGKISGELGSRR